LSAEPWQEQASQWLDRNHPAQFSQRALRRPSRTCRWIVEANPVRLAQENSTTTRQEPSQF
jgi:hypothetical protein